MFLLNPFFSQLAVCSLGKVAYYSDCSSIHSSDCFDYSTILGPCSGFDSDRCYPHTDPVADLVKP